MIINYNENVNEKQRTIITAFRCCKALQSILHADSKLTIAIGEFSSSSPSVLINSDWAEQRIRSLKEIIHTEKRRYEVILEKINHLNNKENGSN